MSDNILSGGNSCEDLLTDRKRGNDHIASQPVEQSPGGNHDPLPPLRPFYDKERQETGIL